MKVTLYSNNCPKCLILKKKLYTKNIDFTEVNDMDEMIKLGFMSMPMMDVDGEILDFTKANTWINKQ